MPRVKADALDPATIALPYRFDTADVWRTILKGVLALNAILIAGVVVALVSRPWPAALALALSELLVLAFTRLCYRQQEGSVGTLYRDRVEIESNAVLKVPLPGPGGTYSIDRFTAIRVEYRSGPIDPGVQGGPNEVVWLKGGPGTLDIAIARTDGGAGREVGRRFAELLALPVEETGMPKLIRI